MKILTKLLMVLTISTGIFSSAYASELPKPIYDYIKATFPQASVRFDGLIDLPDNTQYIPVFPINYEDIQNPTKIVQTIPENQDFKSKPDMILFANNFSLLKVIKNPGESPTLISSDEIPLTVKLGLLPQDLLVPPNLVIPPELRIILGDLKIPVKAEKDISKVSKQNNKSSNNPEQPVSLITNSSGLSDNDIKYLSEKRFYVANFDSNSIYVVDPQVGRPEKAFQLSSIPSSIIITGDDRYLLVPELASNRVSIIDTVDDSVVRELTVGNSPSSIVLTNTSNIAYIANRLSSSISVLDLRSMNVTDEIKVTGNPTNLLISEDNQKIYYVDTSTNKIYCLELGDINKLMLVTQVNNISKIYKADNYLYILSRSDNSLIVYDLKENKQVKTVNVGEKPVDVKILNNKIYILNAGSDSISIINPTNFEVMKTVTLQSGGFPKSIVVLGSGNKALISNISAYEMLTFDLDQDQVTGRIPISVSVGSLVISQIK